MSKPAQVKIISDGTGYGTQVLDVDGCPIQGVSSITVTVEAAGLATATLVFENVILEMKARAQLLLETDGSE